MLNLVKYILVVYFTTFVHLTFTLKIGCGNDYVTSNWDLDAFQYYFLPSNIEKTLYCIGFDRNRLTNDDESATTLHETGGLVLVNERNHGFGFETEETKVVSVSTETNFGFLLTETH